MERNLKTLLTHWPAGTIKSGNTLFQSGHYSRQAFHQYCRAGWVVRLGQGIYAKMGDIVGWEGALEGLETQLGLPIKLGGLSALQLHGLGQYVAFDESLYLYNTGTEKHALPAWFSRLIKNTRYIQLHLFQHNGIGFVSHDIGKITIHISSPERALLEMLALVPDKMSFQHAFEIVENARLLEPNLMQKMLENCLSIKVKRLFLYMADSNQLPCFRYLNANNINLGRGERVIGQGGTFNSKYLISVPKILSDEPGSDGV